MLFIQSEADAAEARSLYRSNPDFRYKKLDTSHTVIEFFTHSFSQLLNARCRTVVHVLTEEHEWLANLIRGTSPGPVPLVIKTIGGPGRAVGTGQLSIHLPSDRDKGLELLNLMHTHIETLRSLIRSSPSGAFCVFSVISLAWESLQSPRIIRGLELFNALVFDPKIDYRIERRSNEGPPRLTCRGQQPTSPHIKSPVNRRHHLWEQQTGTFLPVVHAWLRADRSRGLQALLEVYFRYVDLQDRILYIVLDLFGHRLSDAHDLLSQRLPCTIEHPGRYLALIHDLLLQCEHHMSCEETMAVTTMAVQCQKRHNGDTMGEVEGVSQLSIQGMMMLAMLVKGALGASFITGFRIVQQLQQEGTGVVDTFTSEESRDAINTYHCIVSFVCHCWCTPTYFPYICDHLQVPRHEMHKRVISLLRSVTAHAPNIGLSMCVNGALCEVLKCHMREAVAIEYSSVGSGTQEEGDTQAYVAQAYKAVIFSLVEAGEQYTTTISREFLCEQLSHILLWDIRSTMYLRKHMEEKREAASHSPANTHDREGTPGQEVPHLYVLPGPTLSVDVLVQPLVIQLTRYIRGEGIPSTHTQPSSSPLRTPLLGQEVSLLQAVLSHPSLDCLEASLLIQLVLDWLSEGHASIWMGAMSEMLQQALDRFQYHPEVQGVEVIFRVTKALIGVEAHLVSLYLPWTLSATDGGLPYPTSQLPPTKSPLIQQVHSQQQTLIGILTYSLHLFVPTIPYTKNDLHEQTCPQARVLGALYKAIERCRLMRTHLPNNPESVVNTRAPEGKETCTGSVTGNTTATPYPSSMAILCHAVYCIEQCIPLAGSEAATQGEYSTPLDLTTLQAPHSVSGTHTTIQSDLSNGIAHEIAQELQLHLQLSSPPHTTYIPLSTQMNHPAHSILPESNKIVTQKQIKSSVEKPVHGEGTVINTRVARMLDQVKRERDRRKSMQLREQQEANAHRERLKLMAENDFRREKKRWHRQRRENQRERKQMLQGIECYASVKGYAKDQLLHTDVPFVEADPLNPRNRRRAERNAEKWTEAELAQAEIKFFARIYTSESVEQPNHNQSRHGTHRRQKHRVTNGSLDSSGQGRRGKHSSGSVDDSSSSEEGSDEEIHVPKHLIPFKEGNQLVLDNLRSRVEYITETYRKSLRKTFQTFCREGDTSSSTCIVGSKGTFEEINESSTTMDPFEFCHFLRAFHILPHVLKSGEAMEVFASMNKGEGSNRCTKSMTYLEFLKAVRCLSVHPKVLGAAISDSPKIQCESGMRVLIHPETNMSPLACWQLFCEFMGHKARLREARPVNPLNWPFSCRIISYPFVVTKVSLGTPFRVHLPDAVPSSRRKYVAPQHRPLSGSQATHGNGGKYIPGSARGGGWRKDKTGNSGSPVARQKDRRKHRWNDRCDAVKMVLELLDDVLLNATSCHLLLANSGRELAYVYKAEAGQPLIEPSLGVMRKFPRRRKRKGSHNSTGSDTSGSTQDGGGGGRGGVVSPHLPPTHGETKGAHNRPSNGQVRALKQRGRVAFGKTVSTELIRDQMHGGLVTEAVLTSNNKEYATIDLAKKDLKRELRKVKKRTEKQRVYVATKPQAFSQSLEDQIKRFENRKKKLKAEEDLFKANTVLRNNRIYAINAVDRQKRDQRRLGGKEERHARKALEKLKAQDEKVKLEAAKRTKQKQRDALNKAKLRQYHLSQKKRDEAEKKEKKEKKNTVSAPVNHTKTVRVNPISPTSTKRSQRTSKTSTRTSIDKIDARSMGTDTSSNDNSEMSAAPNPKVSDNNALDTPSANEILLPTPCTSTDTATDVVQAKEKPPVENDTEIGVVEGDKPTDTASTPRNDTVPVSTSPLDQLETPTAGSELGDGTIADVLVTSIDAKEHTRTTGVDYASPPSHHEDIEGKMEQSHLQDGAQYLGEPKLTSATGSNGGGESAEGPGGLPKVGTSGKVDDTAVPPGKGVTPDDTENDPSPPIVNEGEAKVTELEPDAQGQMQAALPVPDDVT